ncbi:MAG: aspartate kinase [[Eubacterium] siraeum]|nr:aspartate kinase [[Eubacterium] siraeum]
MIEIKVFEGITSVSFSEKLTENSVYCDIFDRIGKAGIDLDMISTDLSTNDTMFIGFTIEDKDMPALLPLIKSDRVSTPKINCGNVKFILKSQDMVNCPGFSAKVFKALKNTGCTPILVTTGVDEISLLVTDSDSAEAAKALDMLFGE